MLDSMQVWSRVEALRELALHDREAAEAGVDKLRIEVLIAIAEHKTPRASAIAKAVLQTWEIDLGDDSPALS